MSDTEYGESRDVHGTVVAVREHDRNDILAKSPRSLGQSYCIRPICRIVVVILEIGALGPRSSRIFCRIAVAGQSATGQKHRSKCELGFR